MKKLFLFFAALLLSVLAVNAANRTIYLDASDWNSSGAVYAIHVWGGAADQDVQFTNVSGDLYSVEIADDATNAIFLRCNATNFNLSNLWNYEWNRSTTTIPSDKDKYKVTSWSSNKDGNEHGEWSVYSTGGDPEPEPEYTYTVVGSSATIFGTAWTPSLTANDMTLQSDGITYEKSYTNVHLTGNVEYKVVKDHTWGTGEFPTSGNYTLTISGEADYDVTFTYVPSTSSLTASATSLTPPTPPAPATVYAPGTFAGSWADSDPFVLDVSEEFASLTMTLAEGDYTFKIRLGSEGWRGGAGPFTRTNNSAAITGNGDNMTINADIAGDYTFTWTYADNSLEITYPDPAAPAVSFDGLPSNVYYVFIFKVRNK